MPKPVIPSASSASSEVDTLRQRVEALTEENEHLKLLVAKKGYGAKTGDRPNAVKLSRSGFVMVKWFP